MRNGVLSISLLIVNLLVSAPYSQTVAFKNAPEESHDVMLLAINNSSASSALPTESGGALSLASAIQKGLDNNPEIRASLEKVNASRGSFLSAITPSPVDISITNDNIPTGQKLRNYGEKTVEISQSVEFPTNYFLRGSKYSKEIDIAKNELALAKLCVVSTVKKSYFKVLALQEQVQIAQENLAIAQDFVKKAGVRYAVGEGTNLERLTAKSNHSGEYGSGTLPVKSPISGIVVERNVVIGQLIEATTTAFKIINLSSVFLNQSMAHRRT
jgi:cobalt-zinc-cadmium resistance protein CzcA